MISSNITVVTPPVSFDLTTLDVVRDELEVTDHRHDPRLTRWIHDASAQVCDYLGRDLAEQTVQETFFMPLHGWERASDRLLLRSWPVTSVTSIAVDGIGWAAESYLIRKAEGEIINLDQFGRRSPWRGFRADVVYTHGFGLIGDLPRAIERATLLLLRAWFAARSRDPALRSESVAGIVTQQWFDAATVAANSGMPPEACALLDPYKERLI